MNKIKLTPFKFRKINPKIENNVKYISNVDINKYLTGQPLNKYWTFDFIETISDYIDFNEVNTIFDIGSRDGYQSVEFRNWFPNSKIVAFEANPYLIDSCKSVTKDYNIEIIPNAVSDTNGKVDFYACTNIVGCSSLLEVNTNHPRSSEWQQQKITVDAIRIDNWCKNNSINKIDLLWIDVQGAEKMVLNGIGDFLNDVKAICTEVEISHMYNGSILKNELDEFLLDKGFIELQTFHMGFQPDGREIESLEEISMTQGECDVIYINKKYLYK
jgi:FkbM family methyltransferase